MMTGTEGNLPAALAAGMGAISVAANLFPKQVASVFQAHREGKDVAAAYAKFRETNSVLRVQGVPGGARADQVRLHRAWIPRELCPPAAARSH